MTLILAMGNSEYMIQLSDRALSDGDQAAPKASVVTCSDARLIVGFSGLARDHRGFETQRFVIDTLIDASKESTLSAELIETLRGKLEERLRADVLRARISDLASSRPGTVISIGAALQVHC